MTLEEKLRQLLVEHGLFESQADAVIQSVKADDANEAMLGRWGDAVDDYPPQMLAMLWLSTKRHALSYIDANLPLAWFRPLFV